MLDVLNLKLEQDITQVVKEIQDLVNKSIDTFNIEVNKVEDYGQKIDISGLDFKKIEDEFLKLKGNRNIAIKYLKSKIVTKKIYLSLNSV